MIYLVGDVQGCADALDRLLADCGFSPSRDRIVVLYRGAVVASIPSAEASEETLARYAGGHV